MLPFVGVDGEGGNFTTDGFTYHEYFLLRAGDRVTIDRSLSAGPDHWFDFLLSLPRKRIYVAFFFDYDVTMMCRDLPDSIKSALCAGIPVEWGEYKLSYRPRKEFNVEGRGRRVTINDVGTFFQCSLLNALKMWGIGTEEERRLIREGKDRRGALDTIDDEVIAYNHLECILTAQLMERFRATCETAGYLPQRWQGPGQLAKAMFRANGIPLSKTLNIPYGVWEYAQNAYYGGWFEYSAIGPVKGPIDAWDIASAYPWVCTTLPCLVHGRWARSTTVEQLGIYYVEFQHKGDPTWCALPVRSPNGTITHPNRGEGWYWGCELLAGRSLGLSYRVQSGWTYRRGCDCTPFDFVPRLFSLRKAIGKSFAGIAIKLALNSMYGVLAQSIGDPPYANPVWAGLITAMTRARLMEIIQQSPYDVYMTATDGVFAKYGALNVETGPALGDWERTVYPDGMHIVQSGVYFVGHKEGCDGEDCSCRPKTRGVPIRAVVHHEAGIKLAFTGSLNDKYTIVGDPDIPGSGVDRFVGMRLGMARHSPYAIGSWERKPRDISYDWTNKRRGVTRAAFEGLRIPAPHGGTVTVPYGKYIGGNLLREREELEWEDTPLDWGLELEEVE